MVPPTSVSKLLAGLCFSSPPLKTTPNPPGAMPTLRPTIFKWAGLCRAESMRPWVTPGKASLTTGTFPKEGDINTEQQGAGWQLLQTALSGSREPATLLQASLLRSNDEKKVSKGTARLGS